MNDLQEQFLDTRFEMLASERARRFWAITAWNPDGVLPQSLLEPYLVETMAAEGFKKLGKGNSLNDWVEGNYQK